MANDDDEKSGGTPDRPDTQNHDWANHAIEAVLRECARALNLVLADVPEAGGMTVQSMVVNVGYRLTSAENVTHYVDGHGRPTRSQGPPIVIDTPIYWPPLPHQDPPINQIIKAAPSTGRARDIHAADHPADNGKD